MELPDNRGIWVDELDDFRTSDELDREDTFGDTLEGLFRRIRESQEFLILLGSDWYGTGLRIDDQIAHVSYWEAELFYAILLGRKVRVFEVAGFQPNGKLEILLGMLRNAIPSVDWEGPYERSKIVNKIHEYLIKKIDQSVGQQKAIRRLRANLVDGFFNLRGADAKGGLAENESLPFFDGAFLDSTVIPNEIVISKLLNDARSQSDEEGRLTKLWVVFRELSSASSSKIDRREFLNYWNRFYGEWASAGSW
ncbi:MAG: hypothetical protein JAY64_10975, partial [Candidatus Thiodiazotropha weberae]|nr:hypothetical protein [Candidatus Thiodiazotropha lotti]MCW4211678.1 hypothetical protein [Candidatus Thiodiazotropha lotti]